VGYTAGHITTIMTFRDLPPEDKLFASLVFIIIALGLAGIVMLVISLVGQLFGYNFFPTPA